MEGKTGQSPSPSPPLLSCGIGGLGLVTGATQSWMGIVKELCGKSFDHLCVREFTLETYFPARLHFFLTHMHPNR